MSSINGFTPQEPTMDSRNGELPTIAKCAAEPSRPIVQSTAPQGVLWLQRFQGGFVSQEFRSQFLKIELDRVGVEAWPQFPICISPGDVRANLHYDLRLMFTPAPNIG